MHTWLTLVGGLAATVYAGDVLSSNGYEICQSGGDLQINTLSASYDKDTRVIDFDIAGVSTKSQYVTAVITVNAYGQQVYQNQFNPCDYSISQLCPIPATSFAASGNQTIPEQYADQIPSIAYTIPDLDGTIKLQILQTASNASVGCIQASVTNGKTIQLPAVRYVGVGIAAAALLSTAILGAVSAAHPGAPSGSSPTFGETLGWFQSMAINGMLSVNYPSVYRSWASNFGFSTGLVDWPSLQQSIDSFRSSTGGNLTDDSYNYLQNGTLTFADGSTTTPAKRALNFIRDTTFSLGSPTNTSSSSSNSSDSSSSQLVTGIAAYSEQLSIPASNVFMTMLAIFAIAIAGLIALILLFKLILELCHLIRPLPKSLESWRQRYWWRLAKAITSLVVIFYGIWTMYSIYQFTDGDSWAAKLLAGLSLGLFTILLAGFAIRIVYKVRQLKRTEGDHSKLYEDKETWIKYSLFYDSFKRTWWWVFIPLIIAAFAKGAIVAGANGHGLVQTIGHIAIDVILLIFLLWTRPYQYKSGNIINIIIQVVRVLSVAAILVFVEELGVSQTVKTVTGFALIIVQAVLTLLLAILIAVNALIFCIRTNPERRRRKEAEKYNELAYNDLEARNHLMTGAAPQPPLPIASMYSTMPARDQRGGYEPVSGVVSPPGGHSRFPSEISYHSRSYSHDDLLPNAAGMGQHDRARPLFTRRLSDVSALSEEHR